MTTLEIAREDKLRTFQTAISNETDLYSHIFDSFDTGNNRLNHF
jgi:hypothetical protein